MPARRLLLLFLPPCAGIAGATCPIEAQSPRDANPERPTYATHAYAVAPGYIEIEQGLAARGVESLRETTSWDVNVKVGVSPHVQLACFGPLYAREPAGGGIGDLGAALKLRSDVSPRAAVAIVSSVTAPTGDAAKGIGAGRALGGLTAVFSVDLPGGVHADANAGPQGIGEGRPQWFTSLALAHSFGGRLGATLEAFNFTAGGAGPQFSGILGAVTIRLAAWAIADAGGERRLSSGSLSQIFLGLTTNIGRVF